MTQGTGRAPFSDSSSGPGSGERRLRSNAYSRCGPKAEVRYSRKQSFTTFATYTHATMRDSQTYLPPTTGDELLERYARGERKFPNAELSGVNLSGAKLDGADFEPLSWFDDADFTGASLRGTSFRNCNVKCATFMRADLSNASFQEAAIESIDLRHAELIGASFLGATCYGNTLGPSDHPP